MAPSNNGNKAADGAASVPRQANKRSSVASVRPGHPVVVPALPLRPSAQPNGRAARPAPVANSAAAAAVITPEKKPSDGSVRLAAASPRTPAVLDKTDSSSSVSPAQTLSTLANGTNDAAPPHQQLGSESNNVEASTIDQIPSDTGVVRPSTLAQYKNAVSPDLDVAPTTRNPTSIAPHSHNSPLAATSPSTNGFTHPPPPHFHRTTAAEDGIVAPSNGVAMPHPPGFHNVHGMHHPHSSDASLMFGAVADSNNNSPGPPSAGMYPPPGGPLPYQSFPLSGPPPPQWRRPMPLPVGIPNGPNGPMPGYPHPMLGYDPSTPHSFHGSQSSNLADHHSVNFEDNGFHPHHLHHAMMPPGPPNSLPPNGIPNGFSNGPLNGPANGLPGADTSSSDSTQSAVPRGSRPSGPEAPSNHVLVEEHQRAAQHYITMNFNNPDTADCQLHIVLSAQPPVPWRAPIIMVGHRLVLGFSPCLREQLRAVPHFGARLELVLDDPFLRTDVLWACLESLYGRALGEAPENNFDIAAAYVAAGHALHLGRIVFKGADDVVRLITNWDVLERSLELVLTGSIPQFPPLSGNTPDMYREFHYRYGSAAHRIVDSIANYIINNFPPNFRLDSNCPDPPYSRIPAVPPVPRDTPGAAQGPITGPPVADPLRFSGPRSASAGNPRLNGIKFGDLTPSSEQKSAGDPGSGSSGVESPVNNGRLSTVEGLLSTVLLNLPFGTLKYVMENNGLGNISGWMTTQDRHKVVSDVVAEREARRIRAVGAVLDGRVPSSALIRARLASPNPLPSLDAWDVLGWREAVAGSNETPIIIRNWVPIPAAPFVRGD